MKTRIQCLVGITLLILSVSVYAQNGPRLDRIAPYDAAYYGEWNLSLTPQNAFPNYDDAMALWWESLDDILEVRLLKSEIEQRWNRIASDKEWSDVWGDRRALAITGFGDNLTKIPAFLYAIETRDPVLADAFIHNLFDELVSILPMASVEEEMFRGFIFTSLYLPGRLPGMSVSFLIEDGWLYLASSKPMLIDGLERLEFEDPGLESHPLYQDARENLPGEHISFQFYNFEEMVKTLDDLATSLKAAQPMLSQGDQEFPFEEITDLVDKVLDLFRIARAHAAVFYSDATGNDHVRAFTRLSSEYTDSNVQDIFRREPAAARWVQYLPRETGSYSAGNILGLPDLWTIAHSLIPLLPNSEAIEQQLAQWQEEFGFDIERDVISWMGDSWAIVRPVIELDAVVPFNRTAIFVEVSNLEKARSSLSVVEKVIEDLLDQFKVPITIETTNHRGVAVTTVRPALPIVPISPSWTLHDDALMITSDSALMRQMLDAGLRGRGGIERNRYFRDLGEIFASPFSKAAFQDVEADFYAQRDAVRRVASLHAAHDPQGKSLPAMLMDRAAYLLGVMQIHKASAKRSVLHEDHMLSDKTVLKQDLRAVPTTRNMIRGRYTLGFEPFLAQYAREKLKEGDFERAAQMYKSLADHRPEHVEYIDGLAKSLHLSGLTQEAISVYDAALAIHPSVQLLAGRESMRPDVDAVATIRNVLSTAHAHPSIQADDALFATAIAIRESKPDTAIKLIWALFEAIPDSKLTEAAKRELGRLVGESFDDDIIAQRVSHSLAREELPVLSEWSSLPSYEIEDGDVGLRLTAATDANSLYLLLQPPEGEEKGVLFDAESIRLQLNPSRDYVNFYEIYAERKQSNGDRQTNIPIRRIKRDSTGLTYAPITPETQIPFFDIANLLQDIIKDIPNLDEIDIDLPWMQIQHMEDSSHAQVIFSGLGARWAVFVTIPLSALGEPPRMDVWNFRLEYQVHLEGESRRWDLDTGLRIQ